jgi:hypothetical protein
MLTFFRKIRKSLIDNSSAKKYLLYAIGEITLVVIGILIALQINNWNEWRKDRNAEKSLYINLTYVLESDLAELERVIGLLESGILAQEKIIKSSLSDIKREHSKQQILELIRQLNRSGFSFFPNSGLFDQITNNNQIDLIQSSSLRLQIIELYDRLYKTYEHIDKTVEEKHQFGVWPVISAKIGLVRFGDEFITDKTWKIEDFDMHYEDLRASCRDFYNISRAAHLNLERCKSQIEEILHLIRIELDS